jgi:hypothetical protein
MIKTINKKLENNELTVEVTCHMREFAVHAIKALTTDSLIDILNKEYKIVSTTKVPTHLVGNSKRHRMKLTGTWKFSIEAEVKTKTKTRRKTQTKKKEPAPTQASESEPKNIRSRLSALSKK